MTDNLEELERRLDDHPNCLSLGVAPEKLRALIATAREVEGLRKQLAETADLAFAAQQDSIRLAGEVEGLRAEVARLYTIILENSPDTPIADNGMTVWDGLQNQARAALEGKGG